MKEEEDRREGGRRERQKRRAGERKKKKQKFEFDMILSGNQRKRFRKTLRYGWNGRLMFSKSVCERLK